MDDILSIGDATLDTFIKLKEASLLCTVDQEACLLCLNYADKIPIVRLDQKIAGNALNVAVGSARLGLKAAIYSIVGSDEIGKKIIQGAKKEKVSLKYIRIDKGKPSNYSVVLNFKGERTILVYHHKRKYKLPKLDPVRWIYYTSVAPGYEKLESEILKFLKKECPTARLAFNPGTHQLKQGLSRMRDVLKMTNVLFLNKEEGWSLVGRTESVPDLLQKLKNLGPQFVVVTDGSRGSFAHNGEDCWYMPVFKAKVVEKTGAGDSFATGFLAALLYGEPIHEALRWGAANSASVIQKIGPQAGLLTLKEMKNFLRRHQNIQPQKI